MKQFLLQFWPLLLCVVMMFFMHRPGAGHNHGSAHNHGDAHSQEAAQSQHRMGTARTVDAGKRFRRIRAVKSETE